MLDAILYAELGAFLAWELVAHYLLHNQAGHTLSNRIVWLEHRGPRWTQLGVRVIVAASFVYLGVAHLQGVNP